MKLTVTVLIVGTVATSALCGPAPVVAQERAEEEDAPDHLTVYGHADYDWTIRPLDGEAVELEEFRGEVLLINLWASWCTPCIREMGSIERLRDRLSDTDVRFLIVAADRERPVRRFLRQYSYDLPIYLEVDRTPRAFGLRGLPTSWLVDRDGRILLLRHGEAVWDTDEVERFIRSVIRESSRSVTAGSTPATPTRGTRPDSHEDPERR